MSGGEIEDLVASFIERREAGEEIDPQAFAREHPESADALMAALERVTEAEHLMQEPDWPAERLGSYRVLGKIGRGGMGRVFRAVHDERPDEEVALKILSPLSVRDERARSRFGREGRALAGLDHPGVVRVLEHGVADDVPFLAMEWVRGQSLDELLAEARSARAEEAGQTPSDRLSLEGERGGHEKVALLGARLARAVAAVHASGVLHRDVKPANVILREDGSPVLVDFGLARGEETVSLTSSGDLLGTPRYMSPEQARGEEVDERADLYSLGVVLYELLTLDSPHPGQDALSVLRSVAEDPVPAVTRVDSSIPKPLRRIVERASAYRLPARYSSAVEMAEDLEAFLEGAEPKAKRFSAWERLEDAWVLRRKALVGSLIGLLALVSIPFLVGEEPDLESMVDRACLAYAAGDMAGLTEEAERILAVDPDHQTGLFLHRVADGSLPSSSTDPAVNLLIGGVAHRDAMRWSRAIENFESAQELDPSSPLPQILIDQVNREMFEGQVGMYEGMLEGEPGSVGSWVQRGTILFEQERFNEAEQAWVRVVESDPENSVAWKMLAMSRYKLGLLTRYDHSLVTDAVADIAHAKISVRCDYAQDLLRSDKWDASVHVRVVLSQVLEEAPTYARAMELMGWSYDYQHDFPEARTWYERAHEQEPREMAYLMEIAYLDAGSEGATCPKCKKFFEDNPSFLNLDSAEECLLKVVDLDRGGSEASVRAAINVREIGRTQAMQELIEKLLGEGDAELSAERRERLEQALKLVQR